MSGKDVVFLALVGIAVLFASSVFFSPWGNWGFIGHMPMMGYGMAFGMFLAPILLLTLAAGIAYYALKPAETATSTQSDRALEIAKERYARGEISRDQYEQLRKDLQ